MLNVPSAGIERGGGRGTCWFPVEDVRETVGFASAGKVSVSREPFRAVSVPAEGTRTKKSACGRLFRLSLRSKATACLASGSERRTQLQFHNFLYAYTDLILVSLFIVEY